MKFSTKDLIHIAMFVVLISVGSMIKINLPIIPLTLQTPMILLTGLMLSPKKAIFAVLCYILLGLLGLPVFSNGGGIMSIMLPSFGFLIGFIFAAAIISFGKERLSFLPPFISALSISCLAMVVIYITGLSYMYMILSFLSEQQVSLLYLFNTYTLIFIPKDLIVCILCSYLVTFLTTRTRVLNEL